MGANLVLSHLVLTHLVGSEPHGTPNLVGREPRGSKSLADPSRADPPRGTRVTLNLVGLVEIVESGSL